MSDFLTNLAARAVAAPSLRPRTPSRFEAVEEPPAAMPAAPAPVAERRRLAGWTGGVPAAGTSAQREEAREAEGKRERAGGTPAVQPAGRRRSGVGGRVVEREGGGVRGAVREVEVRREMEVRKAEPPPPHRFEEQAPRVIERERTNVVRERDVERRERVVRTTVDRNTRIASPRVSENRGDAKAEPTIQVSIGRVEVRAAVAQAAPKRGSAKTPAMSIDDYVARKGRERR